MTVHSAATRPDFRIQEDVVAELAFDPATDASHVTVGVTDGIVTLGGTVPSYADKLAAERAAARVGGVRAVVMHVAIDVPAHHQRTDADLASLALAALAADVTLPADRITVTVERGHVTLDGTVEWDFQKRNAHRALAHIGGITGINDRLTLTPRPAVADVKTALQRALERNARLDAGKLEVEIDGDTVTIKGPVHSIAEGVAATRSAFTVPGVGRVRNFTYVAE